MSNSEKTVLEQLTKIAASIKGLEDGQKELSERKYGYTKSS